jgi:integrase
MATRRGHNEGTIKHRSDGRWEAMFTLPNSRRKSLYGKTRKEVQEKLRAALRDLDAGLDLAAGRQTVGQCLDRWLDDVVKPRVRPKTHKDYAQLIRLYINPALGRVQLAKLSPAHVQKMMGDMTAQGLSPRTVQYTRGVLRSALGQALKWGIVSRNVATLVDPPRMEKKRVTALSAEQARKLLDSVKDQNDRLWPLLTVAVMTGLRQAELLGLRWSDVNLTANTLHVAHTVQRIDGEWCFVEPKSKRSARTLSLTAEAADALRAQRSRQADERLAAGTRWQERNLVFTSAVGTPLEPSNLNGRLHTLLEACGLPRKGMHSLRHCFASVLVSNGVSPRVVMEALGHSQISLTMDTYAHVMPAALQDAARVLEDAFSMEN